MWDGVRGKSITDMQARGLWFIREFDRFVFVVVVIGGLADEIQAVQLMDYFERGHVTTAEFFR